MDLELVYQLLLAAILVEAVVTSANLIYTKEFDWRYVMAIVISIGLALAFGWDLFKAAGFDARVDFVGEVFTGIILARGANYVNDLIGLLRAVTTKVKNGQ
jgi:hypothetical protein